MLKIYHAPGTRSLRPIWLCYELGMQVEIETVAFTQEYLSTPEWRSISPAGKLPVLEDGELIMFESGAMMEYILDAYGDGRFRPSPGTKESALYHQWAWFAEATLARPLGLNRLLRSTAEEGADLAGLVREKVDTCLGVVEQALADNEYLLTSGFCAADIMMGYSLELMRRFELLTNQPHSMAYLERLKQRKALIQTMSVKSETGE